MCKLLVIRQSTVLDRFKIELLSCTYPAPDGATERLLMLQGRGKSSVIMALLLLQVPSYVVDDAC